jgi:23S rRNA (guanosine2251-2'-O)-methyltransferase
MSERFIDSFHAIREYLKTDPGACRLLTAGAGRRIDELVGLAQGLGVPVEKVAEHELVRLAPDQRGAVLALSDTQAPRDFAVFLAGLASTDALVVLLDGITDPANLGTVLRSADLFFVDAVAAPQRRSAGPGDTVARVSAGASAHVPFFAVANLVRAIDQLKQARFWVYGADPRGESILTTDLRGRTALVLGAEGRGISRLAGEKCDGRVSIPTHGHIDSLNIAVAAGIIMYEVRRQQGRL